CVSRLVTVTFTAPAACAGVVAVILAPLTTVTPVAAAPPMLTVAPATNPVPLIVTSVPPAVVPETSVTLRTLGASATYVNPFVNVPLCVSVLVTVTFTAPAACAGVVAVIVPPSTTATPVAGEPPMLTVAPERNPAPVIVTSVAPAVV